jgi:hypothetical protein
MKTSKEVFHRGERDELRSRSHDVAGGLKAAALKKKEEETQKVSASQDHLENHRFTADEINTESAEGDNRRVVVLHPGGDHFSELWAIWRRPWLADEATKPEAQHAFIEACNHPDPEVRADPVEIIERARNWVIDFPDDPRFLPKLSTWLAGRGWETEPPPPRHRRRDRKISAAEWMLYHGEVTS